jgi:dihydroorotate dehydrogenase
MKLRGIDFGFCVDQSGVRGFFGEGYPYHTNARFAGLNWNLTRWGLTFAGSTFTAKTTTLMPRKGNLAMKEDGITPVEMFPDCIVVNHLKGVALNAVGLSGPGAEALLEQKRWQLRRVPFFLSFMSVEQKRSDRLAELREFVSLLIKYKSQFLGPFALQINFSCANVQIERETEDLVDEVVESLFIAQAIDVPLVPKFNLLLPPWAARKVTRHQVCDAISITNAIPWGQLSDEIPWSNLFPTADGRSPLHMYGGGALSGAPLLPLVEKWVRTARENYINKPIITGGGLLDTSGVDRLALAGASAVAVGSITMLRPWRLQRVIDRANKRGQAEWFWDY